MNAIEGFRNWWTRKDREIQELKQKVITLENTLMTESLNLSAKKKHLEKVEAELAAIQKELNTSHAENEQLQRKLDSLTAKKSVSRPLSRIEQMIQSLPPEEQAQVDLKRLGIEDSL